MGNLHSRPYKIDPSTYATKFDETVQSADTREEAVKDYTTFDYIIVGAGAAGCVLANRLSEDPNVTVLLVEAGASHEGQTFSKIPIGFGKIFRTAGDWAYYTTPQHALNDRVLFWPRGKMLGGSTSINAMMYQHCSPSDFDEWERMGAKGWSYKDLAPFFRSSEKFTPHVLYPDVKLEDRGDSGLWQTSYSYLSPICGKFIKACEELGIRHNPDINTPRGSLGVTKFVTFIDTKGQRSSTATAYLSENVINRKNLTIAIQTIATRVLFSSEGTPRAIGLEITKDASSPRFRVAARKEVIISAGALNTPQLLNLSGIGAKDELETLEIPVVKDLPMVGKNLLDHLMTIITCRAKKGTSLDYLANPIKSLIPIAQWYLTGKGPATSNAGEVASFVRSMDDALPFTSKASPPVEVEDATSGPDAPDLELIGAPLAFLQHGFEHPPAGANCFSVGPVHLRPLSTGRVFLGSASPFDKVQVDPNYLSHPNDMKVLLRGMRLSLRIARTAALAPMLELKPHSEDKQDLFWPGDADPDKITDAELEEYIRRRAETLYHPVGTARMGVDERTSVVNSDLKVHGVEGLRVIDASVFPTQVSGHPTATIVSMAEKASKMILAS